MSQRGNPGYSKVQTGSRSGGAPSVPKDGNGIFGVSFEY
jgi:hypothetical protein